MTSTSVPVPVPFSFILVKLRVNARKIERLEEIGVRVIERTDTRALALQAEHVDQRGEAHYVRRGERVNAAGQKLGDSGELTIEFNPDNPGKGQVADPKAAMNLELLSGDLHTAGYVLADVHIVRRPGEQNGMGFLVLVFQVGTESLELGADLEAALDQYVDGYYRSVFVWENPDGSATINANRAVVGDELDAVSDRRTLRFAWADGQTSWLAAPAA